MHEVQRKLLALSEHDDLASMSLRKIGERIGVVHAAQVKHHLDHLIKNGYLLRNSEGTYRRADNAPATTTTSTIAPGVRLMSIPFMGEADCGEATKFATGEIQSYLSVSPRVTRCTSTKDLFALKARGDSMDRASVGGKSIEDSDYLLVKKCDYSQLDDNDYVVSMIDGLANVKRFHLDKQNRRIVLSSESHTNYPPIIIASDDIQYYEVAGKVVDVIKGIDHLVA